MVYLILFFLVFFVHGKIHAALIENISAFVFGECIVEWLDDAVDKWTELLIGDNPIEVVINVFEGAEGDSGEVLEVLLVIGHGRVH